jgi:hypothetical protein
VHIVETQQRHAAQQPTTPAPSAVELRRELANANANCAAADRVAKRAKDIADKAEMLRAEAADSVQRLSRSISSLRGAVASSGLGGGMNGPALKPPVLP